MKSLKAVTIIYSICLIVVGAASIVFPEQLMQMIGFAELPSSARMAGMLLGAAYLAMGFWAITAARDPLGNLAWLKLLVTKASCSIAILLYLGLRDYVEFGPALTFIVADAAFVTLSLVFYPRATQRAAKAQTD